MPVSALAPRTVLQTFARALSASDSAAAVEQAAPAATAARSDLGALVELAIAANGLNPAEAGSVTEGACAVGALVSGDDAAQSGGVSTATELFAHVGVQTGGN